MADGSDVDIDQVAKFGQQTLSRIGDFSSATGGPISKIGGCEAGMCGTNEAQTFNAWHGAAMESLGKFMKDTSIGFESLGYGAITIAANYRKGDIDQGNAMTEVMGAFNPADGTPSAAGDFAAAQKKAEAKGKKPDPGDGESLLPPGHDTNPTGENPNVCTVNQTPSEQVQQHQHLYGENERWKPEDPNAPVEVDPATSVPLGPGMI